MPKDDDRKDRSVVCSFCHKKQEQVEKLIAGNGVYICNECVDLCQAIIDQDKPHKAADRARGEKPLRNLPKPRDSKYGAYYFPWIQVNDPEKGNVFVPPSGHIAGVYSRVDSERSVKAKRSQHPPRLTAILTGRGSDGAPDRACSD